VFEDLPEPVRNVLTEIEYVFVHCVFDSSLMNTPLLRSYIRGRIEIFEELKAKKLGEEIEKTAQAVRDLRTVSR
jgi:hypothetical protein